ncbi:MAG: DUF4974 domain-containing protein [Gammaproteobacteria bacterium]|nr:DUF4974 domain-containing protein [Gammaproteobacteria bacterium]
MGAPDSREAAVHWFVRMHADDVTEATRREHDAWRSEDEDNREQYRVVEHALEQLSGLDDWMRIQSAELNRRVMARQVRHNKGWVAGLAAAAAIVAAVAYWISLDPEIAYKTGRAEQREIALDDGSRIHLNAASEVIVRYTSTLREVELVRGEGVFDVGREQNRPFVTTAADTDVVAVGTQFRVRLDGDVVVTVLEGTVGVSTGGWPDADTAKDRSILVRPNTAILNANDQVTVESNGDITDIETVDAFAATAWREGKLIFDGTPLREVIEEIARHSPVEIIVSDDVPDHPITGLIHIRSTDAMLRFVSSAVPVTAVRTSAEVIVLHVSR